MKIRFLAIDGFNLIRRIFEARHAESAKDMLEVVGAAKNSVQRALGKHSPTHCAVVLEQHDKTWRHLLYPEYKANRSATPLLLIDHLDEFRTAFLELGVDSCEVSNYEADDVVATIASVVSSHDGECIILSTDKVYLQLLSGAVAVYDHFNDAALDSEYVQKKFQVSVARYVDYLSMMGDRSNNIKGVTGIGPKAALELLDQFHSLDNILRQQPGSRLLDKVLAAESDARRCYQLISLKRDVELGRTLKSFRIK